MTDREFWLIFIGCFVVVVIIVASLHDDVP